jgi:hypothetical protein
MIFGAIKTAALVYFIAAIIGFATAFIIKIMFAAMKFNRKQNGFVKTALAQNAAQAKQEQEV